MAGDLSNDCLGAEIRCPVCRAVQAPADVCRRCRCDLGLVRATIETFRQQRGQCLQSIRKGAWPDALRHARAAHELCPSRESTRLIAVCHLFCQQWPSALAAARARPIG